MSSPVQAQDSGEMIKNLFGSMLQGAIRKQQNKQFQKNWLLCFEHNNVSACDKALKYPNLKTKYRHSLIAHRNKLLNHNKNPDEQILTSPEFNNQNIALETQLSEERRLRSELQQKLLDANRQAQNLKSALQQEQLDQRDLKQQLHTAEIKLAALQKLVGEFDAQQSQLQSEVKTLKSTLKDTVQIKTQQQQIFIVVLIATSLITLVLLIMVFRRPMRSETLPVEQKTSDASDDFKDNSSELPEVSNPLDEKQQAQTLKPHTVTLTGNLIDDVRQALHG